MTKTNTYTIYAVFIAMASLMAYSFSGAAWTAPAGAPPSNNTEAPINIGTEAQVKAGNVGANIVSASSAVWSDAYCDKMGKNCVPSGNPSGGKIFTKCTNADSANPNNIPCYDAARVTNIPARGEYRALSCITNSSSSNTDVLGSLNDDSVNPYITSGQSLNYWNGSWIYFNRHGNWQSCDDGTVVVANISL